MSGAERIAAERRRQVEAEGWTPEHDDEHQDCELAIAAACYAMPPWIPLYADLSVKACEECTGPRKGRWAITDPWPWDAKWDKRPAYDCTTAERIRALEKAGALIAAEIDRLLRAAP